MELNKSIFKGLLIIDIISLFLLFGTNIGWFVYMSKEQKETITEEYSQKVENIDTVGDIVQNNN
mgnify:CR=1 FL=1